jgi:hypothetical protein
MGEEARFWRNKTQPLLNMSEDARASISSCQFPFQRNMSYVIAPIGSTQEGVPEQSSEEFQPEISPPVGTLACHQHAS